MTVEHHGQARPKCHKLEGFLGFTKGISKDKLTGIKSRYRGTAYARFLPLQLGIRPRPDYTVRKELGKHMEAKREGSSAFLLSSQESTPYQGSLPLVETGVLSDGTGAVCEEWCKQLVCTTRLRITVVSDSRRVVTIMQLTCKTSGTAANI